MTRYQHRTVPGLVTDATGVREEVLAASDNWQPVPEASANIPAEVPKPAAPAPKTPKKKV